MWTPKGKKHKIPAPPPINLIGRYHTLVVSDKLWVSWLFSAVEKIDVGILPETYTPELLPYGTIYRPDLDTFSTGLAYNAGSIFIGGGIGVTEVSEATGVRLNQFADTQSLYAGCLLSEDGGIYAPLPFFGGLRKYDYSGNLLIDSLELPVPHFGDPINSIISDGTSIWVTYVGGNRVSRLSFDLTTVDSFQTEYRMPIGIAFDGTNIWVSFQGSATQPALPDGGVLAKYDTDFNELDSYIISDCLGYIEYFADIDRLGVNDWANNSFKIVNPANGAVVQDTPVGDWAGRPSIDSRGYVFVASYIDNTVTRIPTATPPQAYDILLHFNAYPFTNSGTLPTSQTAPSSRFTSVVGEAIYGTGSLRSTQTYAEAALNVLTTNPITILTAWTIRMKFKVRNTSVYLELLEGWADSYLLVAVNDSSNVIQSMPFNPFASATITANTVQELSIELFSGTLYTYVDGTLVGSIPYVNPFTSLPIGEISLVGGTRLFKLGNVGNTVASGEETITDEFIFVNGTALAGGASSYAVQVSPYLP